MGHSSSEGKQAGAVIVHPQERTGCSPMIDTLSDREIECMFLGMILRDRSHLDKLPGEFPSVSLFVDPKN